MQHKIFNYQIKPIKYSPNYNLMENNDYELMEGEVNDEINNDDYEVISLDQHNKLENSYDFLCKSIQLNQAVIQNKTVIINDYFEQKIQKKTNYQENNNHLLITDKSTLSTINEEIEGLEDNQGLLANKNTSTNLINLYIRDITDDEVIKFANNFEYQHIKNHKNFFLLRDKNNTTFIYIRNALNHNTFIEFTQYQHEPNLHTKIVKKFTGGNINEGIQEKHCTPELIVKKINNSHIKDLNLNRLKILIYISQKNSRVIAPLYYNQHQNHTYGKILMKKAPGEQMILSYYSVKKEKDTINVTQHLRDVANTAIKFNINQNFVNISNTDQKNQNFNRYQVSTKEVFNTINPFNIDHNQLTEIINDFLNTPQIVDKLNSLKFIQLKKFTLPTIKKLFETIELVHSFSILHCDLKPDNLIINTQANFIIDFSIIDWDIQAYTPIFLPLTSFKESRYLGLSLLQIMNKTPQYDVYAALFIVLYTINPNILTLRKDLFNLVNNGLSSIPTQSVMEKYNFLIPKIEAALYKFINKDKVDTVLQFIKECDFCKPKDKFPQYVKTSNFIL